MGSISHGGAQTQEDPSNRLNCSMSRFLVCDNAWLVMEASKPWLLSVLDPLRLLSDISSFRELPLTNGLGPVALVASLIPVLCS